MSIFTEKLTPEEELSGFTPEETDNETFSLKNFGGKYPKEVPDFDESTFLSSNTASTYASSDIQEEVDATNIADDIENSIDTNEELNENTDEIEEADATNIADDVENNIDTNEELVEVNEIDEIEEANATINETENTGNEDIHRNIDSIEDVLNMNIEDDENIERPSDFANFDDIAIEQVEEANANEISEDTTIEQTSTTNTETTTEQSLELDEEFKKMLMADIANENSVKKESSNAKTNNSNNEDEVIDFSSPVSTILSSGTDEMEADLITMDIQSRHNETDEEQQNEIVTDNYNIYDSVQTFTQDNETNVLQNEPQQKQSYAHSANLTNQKSEEREPDNTKGKSNKFIIIVAIVSLVMILLIGGIIGFLYLKNKSNLPENTTTEEVKTIDSTTTEEPTPSEIADTTAQSDSFALADSSHIADSLSAVQDSITKDSLKKLETNSVPPTIKEQPIVVPSLSKKVDKPSTPNLTPPTVDKTPANMVYTIQIYASPSKEDANKRKELLAQKGINGKITEQKIKGEVWYRVRFGKYSTYEDAMDDAIRKGFSNAWIERVK